jgi:hypothetical protein
LNSAVNDRRFFVIEYLFEGGNITTLNGVRFYQTTTSGLVYGQEYRPTFSDMSSTDSGMEEAAQRARGGS